MFLFKIQWDTFLYERYYTVRSAMHMQRQAYFLGHAYAAPALHMQRPEKINFLQNYKKIIFSTSS